MNSSIDTKETNFLKRLKERQNEVSKEKTKDKKHIKNVIDSINTFFSSDHLESKADAIKDYIIKYAPSSDINHFLIMGREEINDNHLFKYIKNKELIGYEFAKDYVCNRMKDKSMSLFSGVSVTDIFYSVDLLDEEEINKSMNDLNEDRKYRLVYISDQSIPVLQETFSLDELSDSQFKSLSDILSKDGLNLKKKSTLNRKVKAYEISW